VKLSQEIPAATLDEAAFSGLPDWAPSLVVVAIVACAVFLLACLLLLWLVTYRTRDLDRRLRKLDGLEELHALLGRLVSDRGDLDLRRLEHVLVDIRDGQRDVSEQLLRAAESVPMAGEAPAAPASPVGLGERATNRLLAMGYERVQIVTDTPLLDEIGEGDGEILVEAHRQGALHKGRLIVRGGRITDVEVHPTYSTFP